MRLSPIVHHFWSIVNVGSLLFTAAVYVGLVLYSSQYTPAPCQSFIDALNGDHAEAADILMSNWFRYWELAFVLFQVALLLGYFTVHGVMTFYETPEDAHKFLVLSAEIFFGWLVFAFRIFGLQSATLEDSCTETDVTPNAYWVIRASAKLFTPLISVVAVQVAIHVAIYVMEEKNKGSPQLLKGLKLVIQVFEILLGAFGLAMGICYGIWAANPWVRAAIWTAVANVLINIWIRIQWLPVWKQELADQKFQQLQEDEELANREQAYMYQLTATGGFDAQNYAKNNNAKDNGGDITPTSPDNMTASGYPNSAQMKSAGLSAGIRNY